MMNRTRMVFFLIIGLALLIVAGSMIANFVREDPAPTPVAQSGATPASQGELTIPTTNLKSPDPVFAPDYDASDGLPTYICGADAFGSFARDVVEVRCAASNDSAQADDSVIVAAFRELLCNQR